MTGNTGSASSLLNEMVLLTKSPRLRAFSFLELTHSEPGGPKLMRIFAFVSEGKFAGSLCLGVVYFDGDRHPAILVWIPLRKG